MIRATDFRTKLSRCRKPIEARAALNEGKVVCGTAWLWAEDNSRETLDYLFVDEAGQMSLTQVLVTISGELGRLASMITTGFLSS